MDYKDSGVDIELGDDVSKILYEAAKLTWKNRKGKLGEVVEIFDDFSGLRAIKIGGLPEDTFMNLSFDGVGTKVELAERTAKHDTLAFDLFAMVCDDAVVRGAEPVIVGSILDVRTLGENGISHVELVKQLAKGYIDAAKEANVAIVNGEVAELGARVSGYGKFNYNWGAGVVWFARRNRMFTGHEIKIGDYLVGLEEKGFRSNGLSLARKVLEKAHGPEWHKEYFKGRSMGELALIPSRIYCAPVVEMFGGFSGEPKTEVHGVVHITGGGVPGKLGRVLRPSKLGAVIDNAFEPCELMLHCQEIGKVSDEEAYRTWNMGQGMIIITSTPEDVIKVAKQHGVIGKIMGKVTSYPDIRIKSKGFFSKNSELVFKN